ncbi:hypothetical protein [Paenibacillus silviterrae]|uniref:hypothetical protein n=1 Tax=Paenibacillus silviterrae TaxID=3242194 RepID=UPI00254390F9|nr:hypothetical protein [Paenibacillus chinjuensis]
MRRFTIIVSVAAVVFTSLSACGKSTNPPVATTAPTQTAISTNDEAWKGSLTEIANSSKTATEKFDEVTKLARAYKASDAEITAYEAYILSEYKNKTYLSDISNHVYMLTNVFKATVVERHYADKDKKPIDSFALDFLQNTKYTYRGTETVGSDSVKSNEKQMDKAILNIK